MENTATDAVLPLDDVMLAMDVVDTLRHRQDFVLRELDEGSRQKQLINKLRDIYHQQGIEVSDQVLEQGVAALKESRFTYTPSGKGLRRSIAQLYVSRKKWGRWVTGLGLAFIIAITGFTFVYQPIVAANQEAARVELAEEIPAQMRAARTAIFNEAKVQSPIEQADLLLERGLQAAAEGNRPRATAALGLLTTMRDTIRQDYVLRVVNRENEQSGFWTFPEINTEATNYYVVVEAITTEDSAVLSLPIENEETGATETVSKWGLRVPEGVYNAVASDKRDDGIIQRNILGRKNFGYLDIDYVVPVLGGAVTQW